MTVRDFVMSKKIVIIMATLLWISVSAVVMASGNEGGHHADSGTLLNDFLYRCLAFAVTVGLLAYFTVKPIRKGLAGRREGIEKALEEAKIVRDNAEAKFFEYNQKLATAAAEIDGIYLAIRREGELERERILTNAYEMAKKIEDEAKKSAAREISNARARLQCEASAIAIQLAEELLKKNFTSQDQNRLVDEYMQKVGELH